MIVKTDGSFAALIMTQVPVTPRVSVLQETRFSQNGTVSQLIYSPYHELDYGTILCWAANPLGEQQEPCTFHIIPAGEHLGPVEL